MSDDKLFQSRGAAAANVLSPKVLCVQPMTSVRVSAERNRLTPASVTSRQSSEVAWDVAGQTPMNKRDDLVQ